jgi:hypothetical protein
LREGEGVVLGRGVRDAGGDRDVGAGVDDDDEGAAEGGDGSEVGVLLEGETGDEGRVGVPETASTGVAVHWKKREEKWVSERRGNRENGGRKGEKRTEVRLDAGVVVSDVAGRESGLNGNEVGEDRGGVGTSDGEGSKDGGGEHREGSWGEEKGEGEEGKVNGRLGEVDEKERRRARRAAAF